MSRPRTTMGALKAKEQLTRHFPEIRPAGYTILCPSHPNNTDRTSLPRSCDAGTNPSTSITSFACTTSPKKKRGAHLLKPRPGYRPVSPAIRSQIRKADSPCVGLQILAFEMADHGRRRSAPLALAPVRGKPTSTRALPSPDVWASVTSHWSWPVWQLEGLVIAGALRVG